MRSINLILGAAVMSVLTGCTSTPITLAPVGPNPVGVESKASEGKLQVFSKLVARAEGDNPIWHQHSDYYIYDSLGKLVKHVDNTIGRYEKAPRQVALPAGKYLVQARANGYGNIWIKVPVVIRDGQTTRVHLDNGWAIPVDISKPELVSVPNGYPVGWRAD